MAIYFRSPFSGPSRVTSGYMVKRSYEYHKGEDRVPTGSDKTIYAPCTGQVIYNKYSDSFGYWIAIKDSVSGIYVRMGHFAAKASPAVGSTVTKGTAIAKMGSTGHSTGAHLHYELRQGGGGDAAGTPLAPQSYTDFTDYSNTSSSGSSTEIVELGQFKLTCYCQACNSPANSLATAIGVNAKVGTTIAVHPNYYNSYKGQTFKIGSYGNRIVQDKHGVSSNIIDVFVATVNGKCDCANNEMNQKKVSVYLIKGDTSTTTVVVDQTEIDKAAALVVTNLIKEIGTVTIDSGLIISEARTAYDNLTSDQKDYVSNLSTLTAAETTYKPLGIVLNNMTVLENLNIIKTINYWKENYSKVKYLDILFQKVAAYSELRSTIVDSYITTVDRALYKIKNNNIISDYNYWKTQIDNNTLKYLDQLLINIAQHLDANFITSLYKLVDKGIIQNNQEKIDIYAEYKNYISGIDKLIKILSNQNYNFLVKRPYQMGENNDDVIFTFYFLYFLGVISKEDLLYWLQYSNLIEDLFEVILNAGRYIFFEEEISSLSSITSSNLTYIEPTSIVGYRIEYLSGILLSFNYTYNDKITDLLVEGLSDQLQTVQNANIYDVYKYYDFSHPPTYSVTANSPGNITLKGWANQVNDNEWVVKNLKPSTTYYAKYKVTKISGPGEAFTTVFSHNKGFILYSGISGYSAMNFLTSTVLANVGDSANVSFTFTTPSTLHDSAANYRILCYSERWIDGSSNADFSTIQFSDLIISETDLPYVEFVPNSPSPDYPAEIMPISGELNVRGKNLFSVSELVQKNDWVVSAKYKNFKLKPNTQYTLSSNVPQTATANIYFNGSSTTTNGVWIGKSVTRTSDSAGNIYVAIPNSPLREYTSDLLNGIYWVQLEEGMATTEYIDFEGVDDTIPTLNGLPDAGVYDTYEPYVEVDGVMRSRHTQRVGVKIFNGTETPYSSNWRPLTGSYGVGYPCIGMVASTSGITINNICSHLPPTSYAALFYGTVTQAFSNYMNVGYIFFRVPTSVATDQASFNAWLATEYAAGTPVTVHYVLATPIVTLGDPIMIPTYPGQTNIYTDCEAQLSASAKVEIVE